MLIHVFVEVGRTSLTINFHLRLNAIRNSSVWMKKLNWLKFGSNHISKKSIKVSVWQVGGTLNRAAKFEVWKIEQFLD